MNKLTHSATRFLVFALGLGLVSTVWAADYTFSNVDSDSLASWSDPSYGTQAFQFKLNDPSAKLAVGNFPSSGYVQLTSISLSARSNQSGYTDATKAILTNNKTAESYTATVAYNNNAFSASMDPSLISDAGRRAWTRMEVLMRFSTDGVLVDTDATYTLTFKNASGGNVTMGYSVVKNDSLSIGWTPAMRIYGRDPSGSMEMPSTIPSTGGVTLPKTMIVGDLANFSTNANSITVGNGGISLPLDSGLNNITIMVKASIPSSGGRLIGWKLSDSIEAYTSYTGSQFEQHFLNNGSVYGTTYGTSAWTRDTDEHWFAVAYDRGSDTSTYLDGNNKITNTSLKWSNLQTSKVTIGGTAYNTTDAATGMVIKDVQIYNQSLGSERVAKVTAALNLNAGWTVDAAGTTLTSGANGSSLPGYENVTVVGTVTVAADGTLDLSGLTQVQVGNGATLDVSAASGLTQAVVTSGGVLTIGKQRPGLVAVMSGGTLNVSSIPTVSERITGYTATATLTTNSSSTFAGTVTLDGETVTPVIDGGTVSLTGQVVAGDPSYTGDSWWWDYEFNGTVTSIGSDKGGMTQEGSGTSFYNNSELYFQKTPYRSASFSDKSELTAIMYCAPGNYANSVLVGFGSTTANDQKAIALVTGANPSAGEMKLVLTDGHNGGTGTVTELADLTAVGATTTKHLYAFVMDRITENETTKTRIRVYLDGKVKAIYKHNGTLTLSNGFQIGSLHGGVYPRVGFNTGLSKYSETGDSGTLDFLRVIDGTLTDAAMAALAGAYPYNSAYGKATRAPVSSAANWVATGAWTQTLPGQADATQEAPNQDTNVTLSKGGSSDVSVAINLQSDSNYESLTLAKEAGATGSLKLTSGVGNITSGKLVTAETSVLVDTTVPAGRVHLGVTSIADGTTVTIDPVTTVISDAMSSLGFGEVYEDVVISMALLGNGASVVLDPTGVSTLAGYGFTAELVYNSSNMSYTFKLTREEATADIEVSIASNGTATWATRSIAVPAPASLPSTYAGKVTIDNKATSDVTLSTVIRTSDIIEFSSAGTFVCSADGTLQGTIKGGSDVVISYPNHVLPAASAVWTNSAWQGTLVLNNCGHMKDSTYPGTSEGIVLFDQYGSANSKIKAPGFKGCAATAGASTKVCAAELVIDENTTVEFNHGETGESMISGDTDVGFIFAKLSGAGTLKLDGNSDKAQYVFRNVAGFTGSVLITDPNPNEENGGKKSFIFGASDSWEIVNRNFPAYLVVAADMSVAAGKTWDVPAGIVIMEGKTLTLGAGASVTRISTESRGTLKAGSGTGAISAVTDSELTANIEIASGATLAVSGAGAPTTLTLPADAGSTYVNSGTLNLSGCTGLTKLHLVLGESTTVDFSKIVLPSTCTNVYLDIGSKRDLTGYSLPAVTDVTFVYYAEETLAEYGSTVGFEVTNVPGDANLYLKRRSGAEILTAKNGTTRTYTGGRDFAGAACWHEWDFETSGSELSDTGMYTDAPASLITLTAANPAYSSITVTGRAETFNAISSASKPYATGMTFPSPWAAAVRCSMPSTAGQIAFAFGDTSSGILGLASAANGSVELFNWVGNTYTILARLKVESPSDKDNMHIYALTVTEETVDATTKKYVSFYRDGEFIHKAEFNLTSAITAFKVGDVCGDRPAQNDTLPAAAADGYTDYVRLYDKVINDGLAEGLSARRPFVSSKETFVREVTISENDTWVEADKWRKTSDGTFVSAPVADNYATVVVSGQANMSVNLDDNTAYNTLIFKGDGTVALVRDTAKTGKIGAGMLVVRSGTELVADYDAVDFTSAEVGVDADAGLSFDFANYPFEDVTSATNFYLTGVIADPSSATRITLVNKPAGTWNVTAGMDNDPQSAGYLRYKVTIAPDHAFGSGEIYYKSGYITAGMTGTGAENVGTVFADQSFTAGTTLFEGDTVVVSDNSVLTDNKAWIADRFNGNLKVTRTTLNLRPGEDNSGILAGRTVTVESGKTLNLYKQDVRTFNLGAVTLAGAGTVNFVDDAAAASISGGEGTTVTVASGSTLTLATYSSTFSGSISGSGTVKFLAVNAPDGFDVARYNSVGTIALAGFGTWFKSTANNTVNVTAALRLDGNAAISALSGNWVYTFAKLTGEGNLTLPDSAPNSFTISNVEDYNGTIVNNNSKTVAVTRVSLAVDVPGGTRILKKTGAVEVAAVYVGGQDAHMVLCDGVDGVYKASATWNNTNYLTVDAAIEAAGGDLAGIVVLDGYAEITTPGYYSNGGRVYKYAAAVVNNVGVKSYSITAQEAVTSAGTLSFDEYQYVEVYAAADVTTAVAVKIKPESGIVVNVSKDPGITPEFGLTDSTAEGVTTYAIAPVATEYTWSGASGDWDSLASWRYTENNELKQATRLPAAGDSACFAADATVTLPQDATVGTVTIGAAAITIGGTDVTLNATAVVLTDASASLTVGSDARVNPFPTTTVANSYVKLTGSTYSVQQYVTVTVPEVAGTTVSVEYTSQGNEMVGNDAGDYTVDQGTTVTVTWTATGAYVVTVGGSTSFTAASDVTVGSGAGSLPTVIDNSTDTWKSAVTSGRWDTAANWEHGVLPTDHTAVTFPASENARVVSLSLNNANAESERHHCASMTLNGDVTFQRANANIWAYVQIYGNVSGSGTLTFVETGLRVPDNGSATISCPVVCNGATHDNFFSGNTGGNGNETFTFSGAVDIVAGELKADYSHLIFNGPVTMRSGASVKSNHESADTMFNGGIIVPAGAAAKLTLANNGGAHTIASTVSLAVGATLTIPNNTVTNEATFVASAAGYHVVSAAGIGDTTVYSVEGNPSSVEIGDATFAYGVDFTNATVTVAVTETNASGVEYTLAIGGKNYKASSVGGTTVTFNNVEVPRGAAYGTVGYTITSDAATTTGGGARSATVADVTAGWINERAASATGTSASAEGAGGTWTNAVTYTDGKAAISDNRFAATTASTASRVVLEFEVCFSSTSEENVSDDAQAAIKLGEVGGATTFMVLTTGNTWMPVSDAGLVPNVSETYKVVLTIDYGSSAYGVTVGNSVMTNSTGDATFQLATSRTYVQNIDFAGSGTLTSIKGDQLEGYMVKDALNHFYATIEAATQAYNIANGPYTVLHDGTAPSGWKIDNATKKLIKIAKGLFFMAY